MRSRLLVCVVAFLAAHSTLASVADAHALARDVNDLVVAAEQPGGTSPEQGTQPQPQEGESKQGNEPGGEGAVVEGATAAQRAGRMLAGLVGIKAGADGPVVGAEVLMALVVIVPAVYALVHLAKTSQLGSFFPNLVAMRSSMMAPLLAVLVLLTNVLLFGLLDDNKQEAVMAGFVVMLFAVWAFAFVQPHGVALRARMAQTAVKPSQQLGSAADTSQCDGEVKRVVPGRFARFVAPDTESCDLTPNALFATRLMTYSAAEHMIGHLEAERELDPDVPNLVDVLARRAVYYSNSEGLITAFGIAEVFLDPLDPHSFDVAARVLERMCEGRFYSSPCISDAVASTQPKSAHAIARLFASRAEH